MNSLSSSRKFSVIIPQDPAHEQGHATAEYQ